MGNQEGLYFVSLKLDLLFMTGVKLLEGDGLAEARDILRNVLRILFQ